MSKINLCSHSPKLLVHICVKQTISTVVYVYIGKNRLAKPRTIFK